MKEVIKLTAYTDAASYNNGKKIRNLPEHSASAGIILFKDSIIASVSTYNPDSSISYGEMLAIYNILNKCYWIATESNKCIKLILHSDSAYCVQAINEWLKGWKSRQKNGVWIKSTGEPVAYQSLISEIDKFINQTDELDISIRHISGHIDINNNKSMAKAMKVYKRFNNKQISNEELARHEVYNDLCDIYAKEVLKRGMMGEIDYERNIKFSK